MNQLTKISNNNHPAITAKGNAHAGDRAQTKKLLLILVFSLFIKTGAMADIAPDPVAGKGIIPLHPVNVQMVSEVVKVDLTLDSAFVECTFNMRNLGNVLDMPIGFPIMNFYHYENDYLSPLGKDRFDVIVKGKKVDKINFYVPEDLKKFLAGHDATQQYYLLQTYKYENRPWYLWKMHFNKNELLTIVVRYRLPNGATHGNRFFNYLLSTGAGWKGKIREAKVIVNMVNVPQDQVLSFSPKQSASATGKQITWDFKNLKPTTNDDILIKYEEVKGQFRASQRKLDSIVTFVDGKRVKFTSMDTAQVGYFHFNKHGEVIVFTKDYVFSKFKNILKETDIADWKLISNASAVYFEHNYVLEVNGDKVQPGFLFEKLYGVDTMKTIKAEIKRTKANKKVVVITAH